MLQFRDVSFMHYFLFYAAYLFDEERTGRHFSVERTRGRRTSRVQIIFEVDLISKILLKMMRDRPS